jgi:cell pole-organizing protein PopZ
MTRILIVAHQTAGSPELLERVKALAAADPAAEFTLLVPATPTGQLLHTGEEGEAKQLARKRAGEAMASLAAAGIPVAAARVGSHSPLEAVGDELQARPGYDRIVLSTFPPGVSRWLKGNLPAILERRFRLPVDHVTSQARTPSPS